MAGAKVLIDRDKVQAVLQNMAEHLMEAGNPEMAGAVGYAAEVVSKQHKVDAVEVVHGQWIPCDYSDEIYICSACRFYENKYKGMALYCPKCGARMDGGERENDYNS